MASRCGGESSRLRSSFSRASEERDSKPRGERSFGGGLGELAVVAESLRTTAAVAEVVEPGAAGDGEDPGLHRGAAAVGLAGLVHLEEGRLREVVGQPGIAAEAAEEHVPPRQRVLSRPALAR
jgi:hypothetical protein